MFRKRQVINKIGGHFKDDLKFLKQWLSNPASVGSIKPTSKRAAAAMAKFLPVETGLPVLELGPGTGALTQQIIERGASPQDIYSIEFSEQFCKYLQKQYPDVNFINGDAFDLSEALSEFPDMKFCGAISGLPLLNFPKANRLRLILEALDRVADNGPFVQMCYGPAPPVAPVAGTLRLEKGVRIYRNLPPLQIWVYRKETN